MADSLDVIKWIRFAHNDYEDAKTLAKRYRPSIEGACYHCHQSAEKILKAYTIAQTGARARSHNLEDLLNECVKYSADFEELRDCCEDLEPYSVCARYPSDIEPIEYHMRQALKDALRVLDFTKSKLKEMGHEYVPEQT